MEERYGKVSWKSPNFKLSLRDSLWLFQLCSSRQVFYCCPLLPFGSLFRAGPHVHSLRKLHQIPLLLPAASFKLLQSIPATLDFSHHLGCLHPWCFFCSGVIMCKQGCWHMLTFQSQTIKVPTPKIWMAKGWQNLWLFLETHSPFCPGRGVLDAWQSCRRGRFPMALPKETMRFLKDPKSITQISKKKPEEFEAHSLMFNH